MKILAIIMLSVIIAIGQTNKSNGILSAAKETETCFSRANFDCVYKYLDDQIKKSNVTFYKYDNFELSLSDTTTISFKKDGFTLSRITKEKGAFPLAKGKQDNDKILKETNQIFCKILLLTKNRNLKLTKQL